MQCNATAAVNWNEGSRQRLTFFFFFAGEFGCILFPFCDITVIVGGRSRLSSSELRLLSTGHMQ